MKGFEYWTTRSKATAGEFLRKQNKLELKQKTASEFSKIIKSICAVGCAGHVFKAALGENDSGGITKLGWGIAQQTSPSGTVMPCFSTILLNYLILVSFFKV